MVGTVEWQCIINRLLSKKNIIIKAVILQEQKSFQEVDNDLL